MDPTGISQLISSVGFPITACLLMWKALLDNSAAHKEEMRIMRDAIAENTVVIAELKTLMQQISEGLKRDP